MLSHSRPDLSCLLMFDYDGTLTPLIDQPDQAFLTADQQDILHRLIHKERTQVAIISGRSVEQLQRFLSDFQTEPILLCGLHGGEIWCNREQRFLVSPAPALRQTVQALAKAFAQLLGPKKAKFPGVLLEDKTYALVLHSRMADPATTQAAQEHFKALAKQVDRGHHFCLKSGKDVLEFLPKGFSKREAAQFVMQQAPQHLPFYFGDDLTDEDAFKAVCCQNGITVAVGKPPPYQSWAEYFVPNPEALYGFLDRFIAGEQPPTASFPPFQSE